MPITLSLYIARQFCIRFFSVLIISTLIILLFDTLELMRILFTKHASMLTILKMSLLRNFGHIQKILPFIILISGILTYSSLTKTFELIIARASGISVWQLLMPSFVVVFIFGIIFVTLITPISSLIIARYEKLESIYVKSHSDLMVFSKTGLWLKQNASNNQKNIFHALKIEQNEKKLFDVTIYYLDKDDTFLKRIHTDEMTFKDKAWHVSKGTLLDKENRSYHVESLIIPSKLTFNQIQESLVSPETLSFWKLPSFIAIAESSGFSVNRYKLYFYKLLIMPFFFVSMIMIGVSFALSIPRFNNSNKHFTLGIIGGFVIYFLSDFINAMGTSDKIDMLYAAILPTILTFMIGFVVNLHLEEGT